MLKKFILFITFILYSVFIQNIAFAEDNYIQKRYIDDLQDEIQSNWFVADKTCYKSAVVSFEINKDGEIVDAEIYRSSQDKDFDKSVIEAIYKAAPFRPLVGDEDTLNAKVFFSPVFTSLIINNNSDHSSENIVNVANMNTDIDFSDYILNLQTKIDSNWLPKSFKKQREAIFSVEIDKDGSLDNIKNLKQSGNKKFDINICDTIAMSVPMDPLPDNSKSKNVQLTFKYNNTKVNIGDKHYVSANINPDYYYEYIQQIQKIVSSSIENKRCYFFKDLLLEMNIDKTGKLVYVKIQSPSKDKKFDRTILTTLQSYSFPPFPEKLDSDAITINYEIITKARYSFSDFVKSYLIFGGKRDLSSFCL